MRVIKAILLITALILSSAAKAQGAPKNEDQIRDIFDFAIAASFHDEVIRAIQIQCPEYKSKLPFNDAFIEKVKGMSSEIGQLLGQITQGGKALAHAHAVQIVANADGCKTDAFKKSTEAIENHQAMLALRAMQGRFR